MVDGGTMALSLSKKMNEYSFIYQGILRVSREKRTGITRTLVSIIIVFHLKDSVMNIPVCPCEAVILQGQIVGEQLFTMGIMDVFSIPIPTPTPI